MRLTRSFDRNNSLMLTTPFEWTSWRPDRPDRTVTLEWSAWCDWTWVDLYREGAGFDDGDQTEVIDWGLPSWW